MSNLNNVYSFPETIHNPTAQQPIVDDSDMFADLDAPESNEKNKLQYIEKLCSSSLEIITARENKIQTGEYLYDDKLSNAVRAFSKYLFPKTVLSKQKLFQSVSMESLIARESEIGSEIFNNQPRENHVVFFLEQDNHWYFHQERVEKNRSTSSFTIHYEVRDEGILKISDVTGVKGEYIAGIELENFIYATEAYHVRVMRDIYGQNIDSYSQNAA